MSFFMFVNKLLGLDSPTHIEFCGGLDSPTHFEFCSGLDSPTHFELLRPCFISQGAGIAPPMIPFAMGWNCSADVSLFLLTPALCFHVWGS